MKLRALGHPEPYLYGTLMAVAVWKEKLRLSRLAQEQEQRQRHMASKLPRMTTPEDPNGPSVSWLATS